MKLIFNKKVWLIMLSVFIFMTLIVLVLFYFQNIFIIILLGIVVILITERTHKKTKKILDYFKIQEKKTIKTLFIILTIILWIIIIYLIIIFTAKDINKTLNYLQQNNVTIKEIYLNKAQKIFGKDTLKIFMTSQWFSKLQNTVTKSMFNLVSGLTFFIIEALIIIPLMFDFYFKNKTKIISSVKKSIPKKYKKTFTNILTETFHKLNNYAYAKIIESIIITVISLIGFYIAGLKGWLILSILNGLLNLIPYFGPWIAGITAILISLIESNNYTFIITLITVIIAQLIDNFYIIPFLIPNKININPLLSIILILIGSKLFGALGMLLIIPIYSVYSVILSGIYKELIKIYK